MDEAGYHEREGDFGDLVAIYREEIAAVAAPGGAYVQVDGTAVPCHFDARFRADVVSLIGRAPALADIEIQDPGNLDELVGGYRDPRTHGLLREIRAVLDAYGWTDIQPTCEFILDYEDEEEDTPGKVSKEEETLALPLAR